LFDVIKHAKPFIIPAQLSIDPFLEKSCIRYKTLADILSFVSAIQNDRNIYNRLRTAAGETSQYYTPEKVRERNLELFIPR
jgi:hypothetical protein